MHNHITDTETTALRVMRYYWKHGENHLSQPFLLETPCVGSGPARNDPVTDTTI
jgi:hypothetical protein